MDYEKEKEEIKTYKEKEGNKILKQNFEEQNEDTYYSGDLDSV